MEYRKLGGSGLKVSPLCLGAMMFGDQTDEEMSVAIVARARDAGVNFIDTADAYAGGISEEIVGRAVKADRDRWVIATKAGYYVNAPIATGADLSRKSLMLAAERSLRRLGTDFIDIYYLHRDDPTTPLGETARTLAECQRNAKMSPVSAPAECPLAARPRLRSLECEARTEPWVSGPPERSSRIRRRRATYPRR